MNYNSIITVYRAIISNYSYENSFQSKVYSTHTKQRLVSQAVVVEYILKRTISTRKLRTMITGQSVSLKVGKGFY